jgi:hypothetical protein
MQRIYDSGAPFNKDIASARRIEEGMEIVVWENDAQYAITGLTYHTSNRKANEHWKQIDGVALGTICCGAYEDGAELMCGVQVYIGFRVVWVQEPKCGDMFFLCPRRGKRCVLEETGEFTRNVIQR